MVARTLEVLDLQLIHQEVLGTGDGNDPENAGVVQHRHERAVGGARSPQHVRDNRPAPLGLKLGDHRFPRRDDRLNMRMLGHRNDLRRTGRAGCIGCSRNRHRRAFDHQDRGAMRGTARRRGQFGRRLGNGRANVGRYEGRAQLMRGPSEHAKGAGHLDAVRDVSGARHVAHGLRARSPNRHGADGLPPDKSVRAPPEPDDDVLRRFTAVSALGERAIVHRHDRPVLAEELPFREHCRRGAFLRDELIRA